MLISHQISHSMLQISAHITDTNRDLGCEVQQVMLQLFCVKSTEMSTERALILKILTTDFIYAALLFSVSATSLVFYFQINFVKWFQESKFEEKRDIMLSTFIPLLDLFVCCSLPA